MSFFHDFSRIRTRQHLITFLGIEDEIFEAVLAFQPPPRWTDAAEPTQAISVMEVPIFCRHDIPKKNKARGYRTVWEPWLLKNEYKALSRRLHSFLVQKLAGYPHPRAFGYVGGLNIRENARDHCGHRNLLSVDLRAFFPSIRRERIERLFADAGINGEVADLLSRFVCIGGSLPLGFPTSPTISNAVFLPADGELFDLATRSGTTYSRYADDISLSANGTLPSVSDLRELLERHDFEIADEKTRTSKLGQAHFVTGLSVTDPLGPHIPRKKKRRLRQELYYAGKHGLDDHFRHLGINDSTLIQMEVNRLDGLIKFVAHHEPKLRETLKKRWPRILRESGEKPSYAPKNQDKRPFVIFVDEAEFARGQQCVLALALSASQHQDRLNAATFETLASSISDVWAAGNVEALKARGLHFTDATEDLRLAYVTRMQSMPFEGYVVMGRLASPHAYEATYLRLLAAVIRRRLMAAESQFACFCFEQNEKVSQSKVRQLVLTEFEKLKAENNRHPEFCTIDFVRKPDLGISVPDFLLGVLGRYLRSGTLQTRADTTPRDTLLFERIRDKYRLIFDADAKVEYSRRRPIAPW